MEGWIKLHRQLLLSEIFANKTGLKIWIWLLLKSNAVENFVPLKCGKGEITVLVKRGQFIFGRFKAEEELFIDGSTIYKWLKKIEELEMITIESNNQYSIITICNYEEYQRLTINDVTTEEQPSSNRVATEEQPSNTIKKEKKDKKDKKTTIPYDDIFVSYNKICGGKLSKVEKLSDSRKAKIKTRFDEIKSFDGFVTLFNKVITSSFLCGNGGWRADFDWLIANDSNWVKVMEGKYDDKVKPVVKETASREW